MELRHLRQAVALVDHGTFSKAAVALNMSQSALTRGIQALEEQVGARLFERSHAGVEPTSAGLLLLKRARSLLTQVEELKVEMGFSGQGVERPVRVATGPYAAPGAVIPAVSRWWGGGVKARVEIEVTRWSRAIRLVRQGRADLAVAEDSEVESQGLEITKLRTHPAFAVVRRGHPLEDSGVLPLDEVFRWPLAFVAGVPVRLSSRLGKASGSTPFAPALRCEDLGLVKTLVASSELVALLPLCLVGEELVAGTLAALPLRERWMKTSYAVMRLNSQPPAGPVAELVRHIIEADRRAAEWSEELAAGLGSRADGRLPRRRSG